jgi:hypothetical protein
MPIQPPTAAITAPQNFSNSCAPAGTTRPAVSPVRDREHCQGRPGITACPAQRHAAQGDMA